MFNLNKNNHRYKKYTTINGINLETAHLFCSRILFHFENSNTNLYCIFEQVTGKEIANTDTDLHDYVEIFEDNIDILVSNAIYNVISDSIDNLIDLDSVYKYTNSFLNNHLCELVTYKALKELVLSKN